MALTLIALGMSYLPARRRASERTLVSCALGALGGTVVFGLGMVLEALFPPARGETPWAAAITACGGLVYLFAIGLWGIIFLGRAPRSTITWIEPQ